MTGLWRGAASAAAGILALHAAASWEPAGGLAARRRFLLRALDQGPTAEDAYAGADMLYAQEWLFGTYSMAAFALANMAMLEPETAAESRAAIGRWIEFSLREEVQAFDRKLWGEAPLDPGALDGDNGHAGYYGHLNLMLGAYALLGKEHRYEELHRRLTAALARRMRHSRNRHFETYPQLTFPPDMAVVAASLRAADLALGTDHSALLKEYVAACRGLEDRRGLLAFQLNSFSGRPVQPGRGSSAGWNSLFLPHVDEGYAREQYERFKERYLRRFLGFAAFREWPDGAWFRSDIDTGPVLFGLGGTTTGCAVAGARWTRDSALEKALLRSIELGGVSIGRRGERRYVAMPPVGDALMLAARTAGPWRRLWE